MNWYKSLLIFLLFGPIALYQFLLTHKKIVQWLIFLTTVLIKKSFDTTSFLQDKEKYHALCEPKAPEGYSSKPIAPKGYSSEPIAPKGYSSEPIAPKGYSK